MIRPWERWIWIAIVVIAVVLGAGRKSAAVTSRDSADRVAPKERAGAVQRSRNAEQTEAMRDEEALRKMANHALSTPLRTERYQRLMGMLDRTTADNWTVLWKEYIRQTLEEGRVHETEWSLFMNRVGEVAGPEAMEYFSNNGQSEYTFNRREVLTGWASIDPQGAMVWLKGKPDGQQPAEFWGAVMEGVASKDTALALEMLEQVPASISAGVVKGTVDTLIQSEGLGNTAKLLENLTARLPEGAPMPKHLVTFYQELRSRSDRMKWLAESYPDMNSHQPSLESLDAIFAP